MRNIFKKRRCVLLIMLVIFILLGYKYNKLNTINASKILNNINDSYWYYRYMVPMDTDLDNATFEEYHPKSLEVYDRETYNVDGYYKNTKNKEAIDDLLTTIINYEYKEKLVMQSDSAGVRDDVLRIGISYVDSIDLDLSYRDIMSEDTNQSSSTITFTEGLGESTVYKLANNQVKAFYEIFKQIE